MAKVRIRTLFTVLDVRKYLSLELHVTTVITKMIGVSLLLGSVEKFPEEVCSQFIKHFL